MLTPAERIAIKKRIASTLGQQSWTDIDLTLEEFGLPTNDQQPYETLSEYVLIMLRRSGADEALIELDGYLHPTEAPEAPPQPKSFEDPSNPWTGQGFRLFLSHIAKNGAMAGELREELARRSIDAFVAHDSIEPTEEWIDVIEYALRSCGACLALLTPGFKESNWTDQEIGVCIARDLLVIPVDVGITPYGFLGRYQALPVKKDDEASDIALKVFELLVRKHETRQAMAAALVTRWATSGSYDAARENYSFLRKIPNDVWTQSLVNDVWEARERNGQLREASINYQSSERVLENLFRALPFDRPASTLPKPADDDDIPF